MHLLDFAFHILNNSLEWRGTTLASFWQLEDFRLEASAHLGNALLDLLSVLVDQHESCASANLSVEVAQFKATLMEASQHFAA